MIRIKADAFDADGSINEVQFYVQTNLIGVVTEPPYNLFWQVDNRAEVGNWTLKAVAIDNEGARTESSPVTITYYTGRPPEPVLQILTPQDRAVLAAPATFDFSAELLSSSGDSGPVEFYVGTNLVERVERQERFTALTAPYTTTVNDLAEGTYQLRAKYLGVDYPYCRCAPITIRVTKLGINAPGFDQAGRIQFDVVTSFPGKETHVQMSTNLTHWISVSTNLPSSNTFKFVGPAAPNPSPQFYRVLLPP